MAIAQPPIVPIVGGGPAGMSCALWLKSYGLRPLIVEHSARLGGMQRASPYPNLGLLGAPGKTARENADAFERHIESEAIETLRETAPVRVQTNGDGGFTLELAGADGAIRSVAAPALVIATGTAFRGSEWIGRVAGARALVAAGRILPNPAAAGEPDIDLGAHVLIVGGGDNAFDVAHQIARPGRRVTVALRGAKPRAQPALVERAYRSANAEIRANAEVTALIDGGHGIAVQFDDGSALVADRVVLCLGFTPNTREPWIESLGLKMDGNGYLAVDAGMVTSHRGVFAIGDVSNPRNPCTASALAAGATAARAIHDRLTGAQP
ncbi:MAG: FAD-dependent oxidoreductase [Alphaproteobacteria bacterium]|nr:FAD-dependent oxidoreductase [Alphaproteobacteria bacterium]